MNKYEVEITVTLEASDEDQAKEIVKDILIEFPEFATCDIDRVIDVSTR